MTSNNRSNIILVGFMASGKSRVGEMLAKRLLYDLVDMDTIIEHQEKISIKEIFEKKGERYFRELETKLIKSLKNRDNTVIVTGGGAPICFDNAQMLKQLGQIFYLDASLSLILKRLKKSDLRPLAQVSNHSDLEKIEELFIFRRPIYLRLGTAIDVNHEIKTKTCDEIIERFKAKNRLNKIPKTKLYDAENSYPIFHKTNSLDAIYDILLSLGLKDHRPVIITSDRLVHVLSSSIEKINQKLSEKASVITFGDGEEHKNFNSITNLFNEMFKLGCTRKTVVFALGGGNVGDVAGFLAAIFLRGVPFVQIPTTLLAMVDASVGGKTGIDLEFGKNLLGAFHNPKAVIIDSHFLSTLPKDDFACGMAEVIKHAIIADADLFLELKEKNLDSDQIIARAIKVKCDIVFNDPRESHIRAHLNLGHTFAHAIEKVSNYQIKHGQAVAIGLVLATKLAKSVGILDEDFLKDLEFLLKKYDLPTDLPDHIKKSDLIASMQYDKKRDSTGLKFILPKRLGEVVIEHVDENDI